jgi:hypothetical protein
MWYRLETSDAPQGHALACDFEDSTAVAYEQANGTWVCWRVLLNGSETPTKVFPSFEAVRKQFRHVNPSKERKRQYVRAGVGALAGTVTGMLLGGLPGIVAGHTALAAVGSQVGGVVGAAGGAVLSQDIQGMKRKLLR